MLGAKAVRTELSDQPLTLRGDALFLQTGGSKMSDCLEGLHYTNFKDQATGAPNEIVPSSKTIKGTATWWSTYR
jgi:hypothetical protein